ncbi:3-dehydroquinate synthase [bacterium]|nr:3-dehydroquinate synthase [bacterium]
MNSIKTLSSEVFIGDTSLEGLQSLLENNYFSKKFLLVDENTIKHCFPKLIKAVGSLEGVEIIEIESGEENKTLEICQHIWQTFIENNADRNSLLINLGGGVITDMGGFIASTYKRGIAFINIPTTLLSQIDASVGGKTGVDFSGFKNFIGTFKEPLAVFVNPDFLKTLEKRQILSGYAEALKHALITDVKYWDFLKEEALFDESKWEFLIEKSINIKNRIVMNDPEEAGLRKLLNFGHTIGHAVESYSLNEGLSLLHGEAVAIGMICESYIATKKSGLSEGELEEIIEVIQKYYSYYSLPEEKLHYLIELMKNDKKNESSNINFTLIDKIGLGSFNHEIEVDLIIDSLNYYVSLEKSWS